MTLATIPGRQHQAGVRRRLDRVRVAGVVTGNQLARWFAVAALGLNAIDMMFFIPAYPFWALVILTADVVALYGLCAYGSRANLEPHNATPPAAPGWSQGAVSRADGLRGLPPKAR